MDTSKIKAKLITEGNYRTFIKDNVGDLLDVWPLAENKAKNCTYKLQRKTGTNAECVFDDEGLVIKASKDGNQFVQRLDLNEMTLSEEGHQLIASEFNQVLKNLEAWKNLEASCV